jgi:hypothetical protein
MCGIFAGSLWGWSSPPPNVSDFYIVSVGFSDSLPGWRHSILEVRPDGGDLLVRYIRVVPASAYCGRSAKIVATATRLQNTSVRSITDGVNLCAIDPPALNHTILKFQTLGTIAFAGDRYTIVAKCGRDTRVIRLADDWKIDMARLKRKHPRIAVLWTLEKMVGNRAFGPFPSIDVVPSEMAARLQPAGEDVLAEMKSCQFDAGFVPRSFKDDVAALRSTSDPPEFSVKLANADHFAFDHYVDPQYPPLAKQAHMSGTVELELASNPTTGKTEHATVVSGNPLLTQAAKESAQQWRFAPGSDAARHTTRVVLEFVCACPY